MFYPSSIKVNKCSGSCNNINDTYAKLFVPDFVKNTNVKVFNLMSWSNQTKHIEWHETTFDLPLGKILNIHVCIIVVKSVFQRDNNYYPQVLLYECLYEYEE